MKKLRLEDLEVVSFSTGPNGPHRGTVHGNDDCNTEKRCCGSGLDCSGNCTWDINYTCFETCDYNCSARCDSAAAPQHTCQDSCNYYCTESYFTHCNCGGAECLSGGAASCQINID